MKYILFLFFLIFRFAAVGQKLQLFKDIDFDSSYTILGIGQGFDGENNDSLSQFWFLLDDPRDMKVLQKDWVFKNKVSPIRIEHTSIDIFIIQNKRTIHPTCIIFPKQGIITIGITWYQFDTTRLSILHKVHPFKYQTEKKQFETFNGYAAYGNSILNDTSLLFFNEPNLAYEGRFTVISDRDEDPASAIFRLRDLNNELKYFAPPNSFKAEEVVNDSFNNSSTAKVRLRVNCTKSLFEKFKSKTFEKGVWEPSIIEMKLFWKN